MSDKSKVHYRVVDGVAVATLDNPPVNALGRPVREQLLHAIEAARSDGDVVGLVIAAEGRMFSAGMDIAEFDQPLMQPTLPDIIEALPVFGKPVVLATNGATLGGGLELALACDARVASQGAKFGLPEIKIGLIPGAGGTQRLPRVIGAKPAFEIMLKGEPISAREAVELGLADAAEDVITAAVAKVHEIHAKGLAGHRVNLLERGGEREAFEKAAEAALKSQPNIPNVAALVDAVKAAFDKPLPDGLAFERELFLKLRDDDRSKALRYAFFAVRKAAKVDGLPADVRSRPISKAVVIGAGTMGGGIAMCFANAGIPVVVVEDKPEGLSIGLDRIAKTFDASVKRGSLSTEDRNARLDLIKGSVDLNDAADADIVIEAVFEDLDLKKQIFGRLDKIAKTGAILATNTSYLDVNEIAAATNRPGDVLGMHFFSPANVMRLLEIVRAAKTEPDVLKTALELAPKLGKVPVVVGVCYGFVGNRMLSRRGQQAERLLIEGALPQDIDAAMTKFGFRMGPFAATDLAGLDIGWRIRKATGKTAAVADALCEKGRFGQKTGNGYYVYPNGAREGVPDPEVEAIIRGVSERAGVTRRKISPEEIVERLIFPMVDEGARILSEGIAARASDIDVIWLNGYGWPAWRGGPMRYALTVGMERVVSRLEEFAKATGDARLQPSDHLRELAQSASL